MLHVADSVLLGRAGTVSGATIYGDVLVKMSQIETYTFSEFSLCTVISLSTEILHTASMKEIQSDMENLTFYVEKIDSKLCFQCSSERLTQ